MKLRLNTGFLFSVSLASAQALAAVTSPFGGSQASTISEHPANFVDPFIGTAQSKTFDPASSVHGGGGNTYPGAVVPFGMIEFGSNTEHPGRLSYNYEDHQINGFSLLHLSGAGCVISHELLTVPDFRPFAVAKSFLLDSLRPVEFLHENETASPGYYSVRTEDQIQTELTATTRTGFARFVFPKDTLNYTNTGIQIRVPTKGGTDQDGEFRRLGHAKFAGWVTGGNFCDTGNKFKVYYAIEFDHEPSTVVEQPKTVTLQFQLQAKKAKPKKAAAKDLTDLTAQGDKRILLMKVGVSYVSEENAWLNLHTENAKWDFQGTKLQAATRWDESLKTISVSSPEPMPDATAPTPTDRPTEHRKKDGDPRFWKFYTALYHSLLHPNEFSDVNGQYVGFDGVNHYAAGWGPQATARSSSAGKGDRRGHIQYANYSNWDTYRSQIQLLAILFPERASDMIRSLLNDADQCGAFPKWAYNNADTGVMLGDPATLFITNGYVFGAKDFNQKAAFNVMIKDATDPAAACNGRRVRPGLVEYLINGYVPAKTSGVWGEVSTTLEYITADYAISKYASALDDKETAAHFMIRSKSWEKLFDSDTHLFHMKDKNGNWTKPFGPSTEDGFAEGNALQYFWTLPFTFPRLIELMGEKAVLAQIDPFFTNLNSGEKNPYYWIGNEPGFATPWLYSYLGEPMRTNALLHRIINNEFFAEPGGLPGNDDLGATSSWFVWAAIGLYPIMPGEDLVELTTPIFDRVLIRPEQVGAKADAKKILEIDVAKRSLVTPGKVDDIQIDGKPFAGHSIHWSEIKNKKILEE